MNDYTWDLSLLYDSFEDERIERDMAACKALTNEAGALLQSGKSEDEVLIGVSAVQEKISATLEKLSCFAYFTLATDATNAAAQKLMDRIDMMMIDIRLMASAFKRYLGKVDDLEALIAAHDELKAIAFSLRRDKESAAHLMDEAIEKWMLRMSLTGGGAFSTLRDKLDGTLMVDYRGESIPLAAARAKAYDPDASVRKDAYEAELAAYPKIEIPMAACLNALKGEALTRAEAKKYDSVLAQTLDDSNMDKETLDAMLSAIEEALPAFRKYLRRKGQLLGHKDGLPFYDLFAPVAIGDFKAPVYTIEEAREKLIKEMSKFSPEMGKFIDTAFEQRWIDVFPKEGKGGGAFCSDLHQFNQSRVLTNFAGSFSDVSTLAHELGHAWHNRCMEGLPYAVTDAPMPLAETASIFNETLLAHAVLKDADDTAKFTLIDGDLTESTQVIVDIMSRYLFESAVVENRKSATMSADELCQMMLDAQDKTYGDGLQKDARHPYMWACKCHYYFSGLSFYNFPYAFGLLFGKGVFAQYLEKGAAFVPDYNKLLRACGSGMVADVAATVGINVRDKEFWRASLKVLTDEIDTFMALSEKHVR